MKSLVLATANRGKAEELRDLLWDVPLLGQGARNSQAQDIGEIGSEAAELGVDLSGMQIKTLADFPELPDVEETGTTFAENALLKARAAWQGTGLPALADDSGLEIDALDGAPGVHSARFAGMDRDDEANIRKVLSLLKGTPMQKRTARFQCALALVGLPEQEYVMMGNIEGLIISEKRGDYGFGYDPIFYVPERGLTFAQIPPEEKNAISHRARAFALMMPILCAYLHG